MRFLLRFGKQYQPQGFTSDNFDVFLDISYPLVHTPASSLSESHRPPTVQQIATPPHTEQESSLHGPHVKTPNQSEIDQVTYVEQDDFVA